MYIGPAAETKELPEELADREKTNATAETTPQGHWGKRATGAGEQVVALESELAGAKKGHAHSITISAQSKGNATNARAEPKSCTVRLGEVEQASELARANRDDARKQFPRSAKAAR